MPLNLNKPTYDDFADIMPLNQNFTSIESFFNTLEQSLSDQTGNLEKAIEELEEGLNTSIGAPGDTASQTGQTLFALIKYIATHSAGVKSVQRGVQTIAGNVPTTVTLPTAVNPNKASVRVSGTYGYYSTSGGGASVSYQAYVTSLTATTITVDGNSDSANNYYYPVKTFAWEVVEYY